MLKKHFKNAHCDVGNACFPYKEYICLSHAGGLRWQNLFLVIVESWIPTLTHSYHRSLQKWTCRLFFITIDTKWKKIDTCHFKGLKGSDRKVSLWGIKNKHSGNPVAESICTYTAPPGGGGGVLPYITETAYVPPKGVVILKRLI